MKVYTSFRLKVPSFIQLYQQPVALKNPLAPSGMTFDDA